MGNRLLAYSERFDVTGYFYVKGKEDFRKQLDIVRKGGKKTTPDLIVVMMNPGGSIQKAGYENVTGKLVPTVHDKTQEKIMDFMTSGNYHYARILNLSDYCNQYSSSFYDYIPDLTKTFPSHSIFHKDRLIELADLFVAGVPVIVAWGVNPILNELAKDALSFLNGKKVKVIGLPSSGNPMGYYHPMRRINKYHPMSWTEEMKKEFPKNKYHL